MTDLSALSNEELLGLAGAGGGAPAASPSPLASMSNEELLRLAGGSGASDRFSTALPSDAQAYPALRAGLEAKIEAEKPSRYMAQARGALQGATSNLGDEIGAGVNAGYDWLTGQAPGGIGAAYSQRMANTAARENELKAARPWDYLGGQVAGGVAGALALPVSNLPRLGIVGNAALTGAGYSALAGAGAGEGMTDRASGMLTGGLLGGALGAGGGALGARLARPQVPPPSAAMAEAATDLGVRTPAALGNDSRLAQAALYGAAATPLGAPIVSRAATRFTDDMQAAASRIGSEAAGGRSAPREAAGVGDTITAALRAAVERNVAEQDAPFRLLRRVADTDARMPVSNEVSEALGRIERSRFDAGKTGELPEALRPAMELATRPGGASFDGLQRARSELGTLIQRFDPNQGYSKGDLKDVYGALSGAMETAVRASAKTDPRLAMAAYKTANARFAQSLEKNKEINDFLRAPSGEAAAAKLLDMAREKGGNVQKLTSLKQAMGKPAFEELAGLSVFKLGATPAAEGKVAFSPSRFSTRWNEMSESGKDIMFGGKDSTVRRSVEQLATLSGGWKTAAKAFENTSRTTPTGLTASGIFGAGLWADPMTSLLGAATGAGAAAILTRPATAASAARWAKAYDAMVRRPTAATAASLKIASRNLAATAADKAGVNIPIESLMGGMRSGVASPGKPE